MELRQLRLRSRDLGRVARSIGPLALLISLVLYGFLSLRQLGLPGMHYDEALQVLPAMQLVLGESTEPFRGVAFRVLGRSLPLMVYDYVGMVDTYLAVPFMATIGPSLTAVRAMAIGLGGLTLALGYLVSRRLFDEWVAALAALLLAVDPSLVFWSRQGVYLTAVMATLATASLLVLLRWVERRERWALGLGAFLLGLGLYAKLLFLWFVVALGAAALVTCPSAIRAHLRRGLRSWIGEAGLAFSAFLAGASGLLAFNLATGATLQLIARYLRTSYLGVENLAFGQNLVSRLGDFQTLLRGSQFWYLGATLENPLAVPMFLAAAVGAVLVLRRDPRWRRELGFVAVLIGAMLPLSAFTPTGLKIEHYVIFLPWVQIFLAACLVTLARPRPFWGGLAVAAAALAMVALSLRADLGYHAALERTGGFDGHTSAIYELTHYLEQTGRPVAAIDWGIGSQVRFLSGGRVVPDEIFGFESVDQPDPGFADRVRDHLADPRTLYVFHSPRWTIFPRLEAFQQMVAEAEGEVSQVAGIRDRSGEEIFLVLQVAMGRMTH